MQPVAQVPLGELVQIRLRKPAIQPRRGSRRKPGSRRIWLPVIMSMTFAATAGIFSQPFIGRQINNNCQK